jgi:penicillin amidase
MLKWFKRGVVTIMLLGLLVTALCYGVLFLSLPLLDGKGQSSGIGSEVKIARDAFGQAVISSTSRRDAAFALGYAHGQDRFFQMDLLRRNAAGELSELFGEAALNLDKRMRFHQLRKRSVAILKNLPSADQEILAAYTQGVNEGRQQAGYSSFEYLLTGATIRPWHAEDSLLVIFSMYLDLQESTINRDKSLIFLDSAFGPEMRAFLTQPSRHQAALDGSELPIDQVSIPELQHTTAGVHRIESRLEVGSNNWAVTGQLTSTGAAMLSDDMHLGLNVPSIWYRAQLNYLHQGQPVQVTGVTLPGAPAVVVGTNDAIAWGFTNGYLDTADWIELDERTQTQFITEEIALPKGKVAEFKLEMSAYGPVTSFNGKRYALAWVAHQPYAVDLNLLKLETLKTAQEALELAPSVGIPVQNLMVVDKQGNAGWRNMGAIPARTVPSDIAVSESQYEQGWQVNEVNRPQVLNPAQHRLWTGNSRVVSTDDHQRFGNGGYALGARSSQIRDRLFEQDVFAEADFNALQHDNQARFLMPWHALLVDTLNNVPGNTAYSEDLAHLQNWQACACPDSVGYTLVKHFRSALMDVVFAPIENQMVRLGSTLSPIERDLEPAVWQLLAEKPTSWLQSYTDWDALLLDSYTRAKQALSEQYGPSMAAWRWGDVNALKVQHPFSEQMPVLAKLLDMPTVPAFGDTFMPAVQKPHFGASQRFIVQPGHLNQAILTIAGGQSGHPLSPYYRKGFSEYASGAAQALLPQALEHRLVIAPIQQ